VVNWEDRNTCVLFGDAAGAMVLAPSSDDSRGILSTHLHTDGSAADLLTIPAGGSKEPASEVTVREQRHTLHMQGRDVFKFAVRALADAAGEALSAQGLRPDQVDHVITHQANTRILEAVLDRARLPREKCWLNIHKYGNTSSASLPMSLDEANRAGRLKEGDVIAMLAIGAGMAWGSAVVRW
jgi:3-oxoacyl-[acyl-carrier-protein] synthase-3